MDVRSVVTSTMIAVAQENQGRTLHLSNDLNLLDTGLDSLCLAVIVARLEDELGIDPFSRMEGNAFPTTVGEFVALYENAPA